ncbi:MAG: DUF6252 family protein [Candidatus Kapaibacterium sp.]
MKPIFQFSIVLLFSSVLLGGCKSNSTSPNSSGTNNIPSGMTATINGKAWKSEAVVGFLHAAPLNNVQFEGWVNTPFQQMPFGVSTSITGPGTYALIQNDQTTGNIVQVSYNTDASSYSDNVTGSITITILTNSNIQGTFNFSAIGAPYGDTVIVTNGQFNVPLH